MVLLTLQIMMDLGVNEGKGLGDDGDLGTIIVPMFLYPKYKPLANSSPNSSLKNSLITRRR